MTARCVWNLESGEQIGQDWRDEEWKEGESEVVSLALSPNGKKVVSWSYDGVMGLWGIDTCKVVAKWTDHIQAVMSVCWSRDGRRALSGSDDGTARQWDVESGETNQVLEPPIATELKTVFAVLYSPDMTFIATNGLNECINIWDAMTGELVATLKGHTQYAAWLGPRTEKHFSLGHMITLLGYGLGIQPSRSKPRFWMSTPTGLPPLRYLQMTASSQSLFCVSFSANGKLLTTGCCDNNVYTWDVVEIVKEADPEEPPLDPKAKKVELHVNITRPLVQKHLPAYRAPQGFFDGVPPARSAIPARQAAHFLAAFSAAAPPMPMMHRRSPLNRALDLFRW
ncbi:WD40 repeat-like protein [Suillus brevipes Sb2]|nr:WD40 repeat-like protein [Suillus brevipes Sb2]